MSKAGQLGVGLAVVALVYLLLVRQAEAQGVNIGVDFPLIDMQTGQYKTSVIHGGGGW